MSARTVDTAATAIRSHSAFFVTVLAVLVLSPAHVAAQVEAAYRISQRATISQRLGATLVSVDYSRPLARGRSPLFGEVVHWGEIWTPGANEATVLELSDDAKIEGRDVAAGRWSVWIIPSQVGPWEMMLDPADTLFHTQPPELAGESQIRFPLKTERGDHIEALTWSFPRIAQDGATLEFAWGTWRVPVEIGVPFTMPVTTVSADEAALYVGEWELTPNMPVGEGAAVPPPATIRIRHAEDGSLMFSIPPGAFGPPPGQADEPLPADATAQERERAEARRAVAEYTTSFSEYLLVPRADGVFAMGWVEDGLLLDIEEVFHEFTVEGGRAVEFAVRGPQDSIFARGRRK